MKSYQTGKPTACLGDALVDVIIPFGEMQRAIENIAAGGEAGPRISPRNVPGGTVANLSTILGRLGQPNYLIATVGNDGYGDLIERSLKEAGVNTQYLFRQNAPMTVIFAIIDRNGERTMMIYEPPGAVFPELRPDVMPNLEPLIGEVGWVFFNGFAPECVTDFVARCKAAGAHVALDLNLRCENFGMSPERRRKIMRGVELADLVLGSGEEEFVPMTGIKDIAAAARSLVGPNRAVIARDAGNPVQVFCPDDQFAVPALPVKVINTTGAGDSFGAAVLAALESGCSLREAVCWGNIVAGWLISHAEFRALPDIDTLRRMAAQMMAENHL